MLFTDRQRFGLIKAANDGTSFGSEKRKSFMNYYCSKHNELMDTMERLVYVSHSPTHSFWYLFKRGYMQTLGIFHRLPVFSTLSMPSGSSLIFSTLNFSFLEPIINYINLFIFKCIYLMFEW